MSDEEHSNDGANDHEGHEGEEGGHHEKMVRDFRRRFWVSLVLSIPLLAWADLIQGWLPWLETFDFTGVRYAQFILGTAIFFYGGRPFLTGAKDEIAEGQPGMMTLIGLAISVAYVYSSMVVFRLTGQQQKMFFWELATLIDVMLLGHWIEMKSVMGARGALKELVELMPSTAHRVTGQGETEEVKVNELEPGDVILVKPGEKVATDGEIVEGHTSVNESMLTGESKPVEKQEGDEVIGGSINGESAIKVEVQKTGEDTYLSQVVNMVREAEESRSNTQDVADRTAGWLFYIAVSVGFVTWAVWYFAIGGVGFQEALARSVTVLVITCPHALGLAIPLVVAVSTALAARHGLLIRDRQAFERARKLDAVVFDKTGTLTTGEFGVDEVVALGDRDESEMLRLAASVESQSEHPIARAVVQEAEEREIDYPEPSEFEAIPGKGAQAQVGDRDVKAVSPGYLEENGIEIDSGAVEGLDEGGRTVVYVLVDDEPAGAIALSDTVRPESREAVDKLRELGVESIMLTGDAEEVARSVAEKLGIEDYFAEVLPDDKASKIKEVKERGQRVAMTGDGVNDAPALVEADLGIAIGAGTDVAIDSADIVLVRSDPRDVLGIVRLANATHRKMVQNLWWAAGYNIVAIPLAAGVLAWAGIVLQPAVGAIIMSASTVIVAFNARLLKGAESELPGDGEQEEGE